MFCPYCGKPNKDDALYCAHCGKPIPREYVEQGNAPANESEENYGSETGGYDPNRGYDPNGGYNPNRGYDPSGGYNPNRGYDPNGGYNPNRGYDPNGGYNTNDEDDPETKPKMKLPIIIICAVCAVVIAAVGVVVAVKLSGSHKEKTSAETEMSAIETESETKTAQKETKEESSSAAVREETTEASKAETTAAPEENTGTHAEITDYMSADGTMTDPQDSSDFVQVEDVDGEFSFIYPCYYFQKGSYSGDDTSKLYYFEAADGVTTFSIRETDTDSTDAVGNAQQYLAERTGDFAAYGSASPYVHISSGLDEDGYCRVVISGADADNHQTGTYYECVFTNWGKKIELCYTYYTTNQNGCCAEFTPQGYVMDCLYRGFSISGTGYLVRSYDQYMRDDMGSKKP